MLQEHFYYLIIDIACLSFPLLFSFHPAIRFYKECKAIFKALFLTAFLFIVWDEWFTRMDVWSFNPRYVIGVYLGHLPIEEILFFLFIPYCLMFMYHCSARYFKSFVESGKNIRYASSIAAAIILVVGLINIHKWYTGFTFIVTGILLVILSLVPYGKRINWKRFWIIYAFGLIPFFIVNGLLTSIPIVLYNNYENLSIRLTTIPIEDTIYNLLLFLCNVSLYEWFRKK